MCGICGFTGKMSSLIGRNGLIDMLGIIRHRGPDDEGIYFNKNIGLGIRRLSIVDIEGGQQPIHNETRDIYVVFNGEIYNYKTLRQDLIEKGHKFYTCSDTEVIVHLYEEYGEDFVTRINGMFAIAVWDDKRKKIILFRDRIGKKPLYYTISNKTLIFASEIKALLNIGFIEPEVNMKVVGSYLTYRFIPGEQTMFKNILKVMPGHMLVFDGNDIFTKCYWDINLDENNESYDYDKHITSIKNIFRESVKCRVENERSIGVFLSGGLDSTIVLSEASKFCSNIKSYSVCFEKPASSMNQMEYDEIHYSRKVADIYGTEHHEYTIKSQEVIDDIEKIITYLDEPIADPTSIPLYYVSKIAKDNSKVVLSGEGADEIFGGYSIYKEPEAIKKYLRIPGFLRRYIIEKLLMISPVKRGKDFVSRANQNIENRYKGVGLTFRGEEVFSILKNEMCEYIADSDISSYITSVYDRCKGLKEEEKMLYFDQKIWLPEDVLVKTDKMSMAHSIELRVPFLDYRLVDYSSSIPFGLKYKEDIEKYILKESFKNDIPKFVVERKKNGFPVPISALLNKEFKEFSHDILSSQRFIQRGYFNSKFIRELLEKDSYSSSYIGRQIWLLITFELWHRIFIDKPMRSLESYAK